MGELRMPSLGADMEYGTLVEWRVEPGTQVERGDIVAVVDTHKGAIEIEVFETGVIEELLFPAGSRVPVGVALARIGSLPSAALPGEPSPPGDTGATPPAPVAEALAPVAAAPTPVAEAPPPTPARRRVSPLARRMAEELQIDLGSIEGTGEGGAVTKVDVERAIGGAPLSEAPAPIAPQRQPGAPPGPDEMRLAIAAAVTRSKREIPHYYLGTRVDMSRAAAWLQVLNLKRAPGERVLPAALLLKAIALALREFPDLNGFYIDGAFRAGGGIHLGMVVSLRDGGIVVPAIHDADTRSVDQLMTALRDVVQRARAGGLRGSEITDPTISVTNLGDRGADVVYGVIYPPQVALVGIGRIREQPWAENGMIGARPVVSLTLAADHRVSDGHGGGLFLVAVERWLQQPERL
ncbi:MAG: dihydrolipoamide acetyltransferase family protein [Gemmatimonadota bacterium]